jgi:hypothetical protein
LGRITPKKREPPLLDNEAADADRQSSQAPLRERLLHWFAAFRTSWNVAGISKYRVGHAQKIALSLIVLNQDST